MNESSSSGFILTAVCILPQLLNFHLLIFQGTKICVNSKVHVMLLSSSLNIFIKNLRQVKMCDY